MRLAHLVRLVPLVHYFKLRAIGLIQVPSMQRVRCIGHLLLLVRLVLVILGRMHVRVDGLRELLLFRVPLTHLMKLLVGFRLRIHVPVRCLPAKVVHSVCVTIELLRAVVLSHLSHLLKLLRLVLMSTDFRVQILKLLLLIFLLLRCKAVVVDVDSQEFALPVRVDHELNRGNLLLLLLLGQGPGGIVDQLVCCRRLLVLLLLLLLLGGEVGLRADLRVRSADDVQWLT